MNSNNIKSVPQRTSNFILDTFEKFLNAGRLVIAPMYVGLLVSLIIYTYKFIQQLYELVIHATTINESELMLAVLSLVDITMVGNLVIMIMIGSYSIFIRKFGQKEQPVWLEGITSSTLKIKMGMSLVGVSSIHLLKDFVTEGNVNRESIYKHIAIHIVFILSTIALAFTDKITPHTVHAPKESKEVESHS